MPVAILTDKLTDDRQSWDIKWEEAADAQRPLQRPGFHDESEAYLDRLLSDLPSKRVWVMDIGCGNGRHVLRYKREINGRLIGADFSISGLRSIRAAEPDADLSVADATSLPFGCGVLDAVLMVGLVYEIEDRDKHRAVFKEIHRVLKPGGVCGFVSNSNLHILERLYAYFPKYNPFVRRLLGKAPADRKGLRFWHYRLSDTDVRSYVLEANFRVEGPIYCNVRSGLGRTWDQILVTGDSHENDIRFKSNILIKAIGYFLLAIAAIVPNLSARTAVYFLHKGPQ
jgi:ubiquinone/menaquinone biosynthesis C-methylase UbiE